MLVLKQILEGKLKLNDRFETSVQGIYAIGDVIAGPMLAHKAWEEEEVAVIEKFMWKKSTHKL